MTDSYTPRRGRPPRHLTAQQEAPQVMTEQPQEVSSEASVPKGRRRKRADNGGYKTRLSAPQREGYHRRWVNDDGIRPQILNQDLAYDFVLDKLSGDGPGTRVSRIVGKKASGEPMYAYLMETPIEEFRVGEAEKEDRLKPFEDAIRANRDTTGELSQADNVYRPSAGSSLKRS